MNPFERFVDECQFHQSYMGALERGEKNVTIAMPIRVTKTLTWRYFEMPRETICSKFGSISHGLPPFSFP